MGLVTTKNFVVANAVENMLLPAKKHPSPPPPATAKADYGKVPAYLGEHKARLLADKAAAEARVVAEVRGGRGRCACESARAPPRLSQQL